MTLRIVAGTALLAIAIASSTRAQKPVVAAARCDRADSAASWYQRQAEWWALDAKHDWTDDSLRARLVTVADLLQEPGREPFPLQVGAEWDRAAPPGTLPADRIRELLPPVQQLLRGMAAKRTWPLRGTVGPAGVRAAWIVTAHDSALTTMAMHRMMEAGPGEVSPTDVAVLEDWLRIRTGRKQIYATQMTTMTNSRGIALPMPLPTEDIAHVDLRRDAAGLPPLAFALCWVARQPHM